MAPPRPDRDHPAAASQSHARNGDRSAPAASRTNTTTTTQPPRGPSSSSHIPPPPPRPSSSSAAAVPAKIGPHPGVINSSNQYSSELRLRRMLADSGGSPAREVSYRLQGVQLLDGVRARLQLPVRTFDTACAYFHKFRLSFRDAEYNYQDAALASLFVACKVEDTIKKSKDILAAAYNIKNPDKPAASSDDKMFDSPGKVIIGLERLILETIGFDFRTRYPQKLLVKIVRAVHAAGDPALPEAAAAASRAFFDDAYAMSLDMYKTFIPIKRTTFSMVMAIVELTALLRGGSADADADSSKDNPTLNAVRAFAASKRHYSRPAVAETLLDLLDHYVEHPKSTRLGSRFDLNRFINIKIRLNEELAHDGLPRYMDFCTRCEAEPSDSAAAANNHHHQPQPPTPGSVISPSPTSSTSFFPSNVRAANSQTQGAAPLPRSGVANADATMRFVFDPDAALQERETVGKFFREEYEEYEVEVDEPIPPPPQHQSSSRRRSGHNGGDDDRPPPSGPGGGGGGGGGRGRNRRNHGGHRDRGGGGGGGDHRNRWGGPYGGGGGGHRGDRPNRGRGRYHH